MLLEPPTISMEAERNGVGPDIWLQRWMALHELGVLDALPEVIARSTRPYQTFWEHVVTILEEAFNELVWPHHRMQGAMALSPSVALSMQRARTLKATRTSFLCPCTDFLRAPQTRPSEPGIPRQWRLAWWLRARTPAPAPSSNGQTPITFEGAM